MKGTVVPGIGRVYTARELLEPVIMPDESLHGHQGGGTKLADRPQISDDWGYIISQYLHTLREQAMVTQEQIANLNSKLEDLENLLKKAIDKLSAPSGHDAGPDVDAASARIAAAADALRPYTG